MNDEGNSHDGGNVNFRIIKIMINVYYDGKCYIIMNNITQVGPSQLIEYAEL